MNSMTQQFFKGLFMAIIAAMMTVFTPPVDWALLGVTVFSTVFTYTGKNLLQIWHSDSSPFVLSLRNALSGILIAVGTAAVQSIGLYIIDGHVDWAIAGKVALAAAVTYIGTTWLAPEHTNNKLSLSLTFKKQAA